MDRLCCRPVLCLWGLCACCRPVTPARLCEMHTLLPAGCLDGSCKSASTFKSNKSGTLLQLSQLCISTMRQNADCCI